MNRLIDFLTHAATLYAFLIGIIGAIITGYVMYDNVLKSIKKNQDQIETTQILILKPLIRETEKNPCVISDAEWDEYLMNGSTLHELKQKHKMISKSLPFIPIKRITEEDPEKCKD